MELSAFTHGHVYWLKLLSKISSVVAREVAANRPAIIFCHICGQESNVAFAPCHCSLKGYTLRTVIDVINPKNKITFYAFDDNEVYWSLCDKDGRTIQGMLPKNYIPIAMDVVDINPGKKLFNR